MLEFKIIQELKATAEILEIIKAYTMKDYKNIAEEIIKNIEC